MLKKLCCLLLLAGAAPLAHAQTRPAPVKVPATTATPLEATATKEHDTMVIELTDAPMVIWRRLAQVLAVRGYAIEHSSPELLTLATYPLEVRSSRIRIAGMVEGRTLMVRAYAVYQNEGYPETNQRARRRGGDNAEWEELAAIGQQLGGTIRYTTSAAPQ
ncbi:hypothetical protein [Hymenobacter yonginensis]|uniref:Uncharacterized protein n=1 Tax=Hymenobacter yonginensis TaxID=748197 RepID=A0ABY7PS74_9BACT|nr:hypothetical protein [Hymenobacter yonginensis]WBO85752.1 hypothetical protein O9Z63_05780 [Hymenobacter yonginensis]